MFKNSIKITIFTLFFWVVYGFTIPNYDWYITDQVGVFSATEKADLITKIQTIESATSIEIAILVVSTVDDDINLAAVDVGNKWWVGKKGQDNGLIVLIAVDDRKWSIQVGYGLEGTLPDLATKQIGETRFPPNFRAGNYYQGIAEMLDDVLWYIQQDPTIVQNYSQTSTSSSDSSFNKDNFEFIFFVALFILFGFGQWVTIPSVKGKKKRKMRKYWRWIYTGLGLLVAGIIFVFLANIIFSVIMSYGILLIGILFAMYGKWWGGAGIYFWWWGSSFGGGWSSFGGFGWGSFGGGGSSGSR